MAWPSTRAKTFVSGGNIVPADVNAIQDQYIRAANIGVDDLDKATFAEKVGLSQSAAAAGGAAVRRDFVTIDGAETRTDINYGYLATPDRIQNIVVPSNGLVLISYEAIWKTTSAACNAQILFGAGPLQRLTSVNVWGDVSAQLAVNPTLEQYLTTSSLFGMITTTGTGYDGEADITTGLVVGQSQGGFIPVYADPGTYDIGVQYRDGLGGTVTVKRRRLIVVTIGF